MRKPPAPNRRFEKGESRMASPPAAPSAAERLVKGSPVYVAHDGKPLQLRSVELSMSFSRALHRLNLSQFPLYLIYSRERRAA